MSIEIKNLCVNVSVTPRKETKEVDVDSLRSEVLKECCHMVQEIISESKDR